MGVKVQKPGDPGHPGGNRRVYVRVNFMAHRKTRIFNSVKAAEAYALAIEAKLKLGDPGDLFAKPAPPPVPKRVVTFRQAAERWLAIEGAEVKRNTNDTYESILKLHILPTFGPRPLPDITVTEVADWWAGIQARHFSRKHMVNIRTVLGHIFRRAVVSGILPRNPAEAIRGRVGREDREVRQVEWLTETELTRFLEVVERQEPRHYSFLLLLATTGMREGEALGLQVGDVDQERLKLAIRRAIRKHRVGSPKSGKARTVDVPPWSMGVLRGWIATIRAEAAVRGQEATWLFPSASGKPMDEAPMRRAFRRSLKAAGILRPLRVHDLRHTYASLALQRGVDLLVVSRQLGHKSIAITADVYAHLTPTATRAAADAFEAILTTPRRNPDATPATEHS